MANVCKFDDDFGTDYLEEESGDERLPSSAKKKQNNVRRQIYLLMEKKRLRSMMDTSDSYWDDN